MIERKGSIEQDTAGETRRIRPLPGVPEFMRLDETSVGIGRWTKALRQIKQKLAFRPGAPFEFGQQTRI
jgi:hypothetical protein